jgi:hypothetical protein
MEKNIQEILETLKPFSVSFNLFHHPMPNLSKDDWLLSGMKDTTK